MRNRSSDAYSNTLLDVKAGCANPASLRMSIPDLSFPRMGAVLRRRLVVRNVIASDSKALSSRPFGHPSPSGKEIKDLPLLASAKIFQPRNHSQQNNEVLPARGVREQRNGKGSA